MPTPAVTLKLRRFRRNFGIMAPKVVVRGHVPWYLLALPIVLLALLLGLGGWMVAQRSQAGVLEQEVDGLRQQLLTQREELALLRSTAGTGQNAVNIERATQQQLLGRLQVLESQNAALKEDVLLFERLIPLAGEGASVRVENFRVVAEENGRYRYRLLIVFQPDRQTTEFRGRLQLAVTYRHAGKERNLLLPRTQDSSAEYLVETKHFLRREGGFELPQEGVLLGVEARVLLGDTLRSKRSAQL